MSVLSVEQNHKTLAVWSVAQASNVGSVPRTDRESRIFRAMKKIRLNPLGIRNESLDSTGQTDVTDITGQTG